MKTIGAFEAKTHLSKLLADVEKGETVAITKHGRTVAILSPAKKQDPITEAIATIKRIQKKHTLGKNLTIKQLIDEGRK